MSYRKYMQSNAVLLMDYNASVYQRETGTDVPETFEYLEPGNPRSSTVTASDRPAHTLRPPSDLKAMYLKTEQLKARMVAPSIVPPRG